MRWAVAATLALLLTCYHPLDMYYESLGFAVSVPPLVGIPA